MRAIGIHQPYAYLILNEGKDIENRPCQTHVTGDIAVHATLSKKLKEATPERLLREANIEVARRFDFDQLPRGGIIGVVKIVGCDRVENAGDSKWAWGPWCWRLANPRPFNRMISWKGLQGFFQVPDHLIISALAEAGHSTKLEY